MIILFAIFIIILLPINAIANNNEAYESAKAAFNDINISFNDVKEKIDATYDFFGRFHRGVDTWRNAVSKETQNRGIEEIDKLADEKIESVIDALYEKAINVVGIPKEIEIPESMKEKAVAKLRDKFKGYVPDRVSKKLGYMYSLSAIDRKLRDNYIYDNLKYIKQGFDKGSRLLGNFNNAVKFIDTFSPQSTETNPVGRLQKVKDFLSILSDIAKPIPLMSDVIDSYAKATDGFMKALSDLDNKLLEARQGSLCGQRGVDSNIQAFFQQNYPSEDCLTYFALPSSQYPHLSPIRAWKGGERSHIFLWLDNVGVLIDSGNFFIVYRYYSALKESINYGNHVSYDRFFNMIRAITTKSNLAALKDRFGNYYKRFEKDYKFKEVLELEGYYKQGNFKSLQKRLLEYQLGGSEDEFGGLCFFNSSFRNDIEALHNKYKDAFVINGTIKPSTTNAVIGKISVFVDDINVKELKCADICSFRNISMKDRYNVKVRAEGFKEANKNFSKEPYPIIELTLSTLTITVDKTSLLVGEKVILNAKVEGRDISRDRFFWSVNGRPFGGGGNRVEFIPSEAGTHQIIAALVDERSRAILEGTITIKVIDRASLFIQGPSETIVDKENYFYAQIRGALLPGGKHSYTWVLNGAKYNGNDDSIRIRFNREGSNTLKAILWHWINEQKKWQKVSEATHIIIVKSPQQYPTASPYPTIIPTPIPTITPKPTIAPTHTPNTTPKMRQFNELTQDEQKRVLDCICRCSSSAKSSVTVYYDPKPVNTSPNCSEPSNGPCVNQGFGCWRHVPKSSGKCEDDCYKSANTQSLPDSYFKKN